MSELLDMIMPYIGELSIALIMWVIRKLEKSSMKKKHKEELEALKSVLNKKMR